MATFPAIATVWKDSQRGKLSIWPPSAWWCCVHLLQLLCVGMLGDGLGELSSRELGVSCSSTIGACLTSWILLPSPGQTRRAESSSHICFSCFLPLCPASLYINDQVWEEGRMFIHFSCTIILCSKSSSSFHLRIKVKSWCSPLRFHLAWPLGSSLIPRL